MIDAKFMTEDKNIVLKVTGHAGQAEKGQDIICASASILAYTVAQTLLFMHKEGKLRKKPKIRLSEGNAEIVAKATDDSYAEVLHTFFVAQVGFSLLAKNYPEFVEVQMFGQVP